MGEKIVRMPDGSLNAVVHCSGCGKELRCRPATEYEKGLVGYETLVCTYCPSCSEERRLIFDGPQTYVVGAGIGNHKAVAKVTIKDTE
jgi:ribosomal protein S27E